MGLEYIAGLITSTHNRVKTVDESKYLVHSGDSYKVCLSTSCVAASTTLLYIQTPNTTIRQNLVAQINSSIATITSYFTNGTIVGTTGYTALTAYNMNGNSTKATTTIFGTVATSSQLSTYGGTVYEQFQAQMPTYIGAIPGVGEWGWNLTQNTGYVIGVICPTTAAVQINIKLEEF